MNMVPAPSEILEPTTTAPAAKPEREFHPLESWRSFVAGMVAVLIGTYDVWKLGPSEGLTVEIDEILILIGIGLIAGMPNVFLQTIMGKKDKDKKPPHEPG